MQLKVEFNIDFEKSLKELKTRKLKKNLLDNIMKPMVENSKRFIASGKVLPILEPSTIKQRKAAGISGKRPLYKTGALWRSLRVDTQGIKSSAKSKYDDSPYAKYHYEGDGPPERKFITGKSQGKYLTSDRAFPDKIYKVFQSKFAKLLGKRIRKK